MKANKIKTIVLALASIGMATLSARPSLANPVDGKVIAGNVTIQQESATKLGITQTSNKAIVDWKSFSIGANEHTQFYQPSASSVILNRVVGEDPSKILGRLTANGQVFLVNPNGIYFGKNAQIDVAGLVASTHNIRNEDFLAGNYNFSIPGKPGASVINEGTIRIADTGIAAFVAPSVANRGVIVARLGKVMLAAANGFTLDFTGDQLLTFLVSDEVAKTAFDIDGNQLTSFVESSGKIEAQGGYVLMTAKAAENAVHGVISHSGIIEATTVGQSKGEIILHAGKGDLNVSGTLDASAPNGGNGGFIETSGGYVDIDPSMTISTAAPYGITGKWLIDPTDYVVQGSGGNITGAQLSSHLNANNVEIQTLSTGSGSGNININDAVSWTNLNQLTLTAHRDINVTQSVNASGGGSIKLRADSQGTGTGKVNFSGSGQLNVTNGAAVNIFYNPTSYTGSDKSDTTGNPYSAEVTRTNGATLTAYMLVNDVSQLQAMKDRPSGSYALGKDVYADGTNSSQITAIWNGGKGFIPVGTNSQTFSGRFFGDDHKIVGLSINDLTLTNAGLFGVIGSNGRVSHVGLESASVTGSGDTGILAGQNFGNITKAYAVGSVTGRSAGGLTGRNWGTISQTFSTGSVTGLSGGSVGGLTSNNAGAISDSFSTSTVTLAFTSCGINCSSGSAGALVAGNMGGGTLTNTYATGLLTINGSLSPNSNGLMGGGINFGTATSSYWNIETTGQTTSGGGLGKTTSQMTQQSTYAGWDFTNIWRMGSGYPTLAWLNAQLPSRTLLQPSGPSSTAGQSVSSSTRDTIDVCLVAPVVCRPTLAPAPIKSDPSNSWVNMPDEWRGMPMDKVNMLARGIDRLIVRNGVNPTSALYSAQNAVNDVWNIPRQYAGAPDFKIGNLTLKQLLINKAQVSTLTRAWDSLEAISIYTVDNADRQNLESVTSKFAAARQSYQQAVDASRKDRTGWALAGEILVDNFKDLGDSTVAGAAVFKNLNPVTRALDIAAGTLGADTVLVASVLTRTVMSPAEAIAAVDGLTKATSGLAKLAANGLDAWNGDTGAVSEVSLALRDATEGLLTLKKLDVSDGFKKFGAAADLAKAVTAVAEVYTAAEAVEFVNGVSSAVLSSDEKKELVQYIVNKLQSATADALISLAKFGSSVTGSKKFGQVVGYASDIKDVYDGFDKSAGRDIARSYERSNTKLVNTFQPLKNAVANYSSGMRDYLVELGNTKSTLGALSLIVPETTRPAYAPATGPGSTRN